jgi:hypothetical protein
MVFPGPLDTARARIWTALAVAIASAAGAVADDVAGADQPSAGAQPTAEQIEFFEKQVRPLLAENCWKCHGPEQQEANLRLDSREGVLRGGDTGPAVVPGQPAESELISAISYDPDGYQMPPTGKLPQQAIETLTEWVRIGAPWPGDRQAGPAAPGEFSIAERARHWSFQPVQRPDLPDVVGTGWPASPIDTFVLARLEQAGLNGEVTRRLEASGSLARKDSQGLTPAPPADRRTWLRRVSFDLIGLPPTPADTAEFLVDAAPDAEHKIVDRLLASPHYGERWGRHWLDLVRYAETAGHEFDYDIPWAWRYRDYVVRALNADLPYDQFIVEQVAGDLLDPPRRHAIEDWNESILGTAFWWFSQGKHSPVDVRAEECDRFDNQIDVLGKAFLGLTIACARCHDHKFDAISTADYYALAGYLQSTRQQIAFIDDGRMAAARHRLEDLKAKIRPLVTEAVEPGIGPASDRSSAAHGVPTTAVLSDAEVFDDFGGDRFTKWHATGTAFGPRPTSAGDFMIETTPDTPRIELLQAGLAHSGRLSRRLLGVLRSETFTISRTFIDYRVRRVGGRSEPGRKHKNGQIHLIVDGFHLIQNPLYGGLSINTSNDGAFRWYRQDVSKLVGSRAYIEIEDEEPEGWIVVDRVLFSDGPPPADRPGEPAPDELTVPVSKPGEGLARGHELAVLVEEYRAVEERLVLPRRTVAALDGSLENEHILIRGNHKKPGPEVSRRFLEVFELLDPDHSSLILDLSSPPDAGSTRLDLARRIAHPANPLTARVLVNRLWHHHFGRGIVPTVDNFGALGEAPSHPELLDWLAAEMVQGQGSRDKGRTAGQTNIAHATLNVAHRTATDHGPRSSETTHPSPLTFTLKRLHRAMVLSATYRMSSVANDFQAEAADPENHLWHRMPVRRLEAEIIRDAILAVSGRLDRRLEGESVMPYLTPFMEGRGRPAESGPLDGDGRRSLYISVRRNFLTPLFLAFDYPTPLSTMGRRSVSNVPAQALALMNNPFVVQQAEQWARQTLTDAGEAATCAAVVERLYQTAFTRPPTASELAAALLFVKARADAPAGRPGVRRWADLCHVLLNLKEFVFVE